MSIRSISDVIHIGHLSLGGTNPIRIQSMTNTDTNDTDATVAQCIRLVNVGCEMVRITAQGITEAKKLRVIKNELHSKGIYVPLVADIHFNPHAAETAAEIVEKVRINPGNYSDRKTPGKISTARAYDEELERIAMRIMPLLKICQRNGTAIRIGTNHGSLSSRIMQRYGDTPEGMVESALEFGRICLSENFRNVVFSMKSSNVRVMVQSTRLLVQRMQAENMNFPIHLGVTEAGDGEDGIIKSAAGIGSLLDEGIGDTIRVSLTGAPEIEIPVAKAIAGRYNEYRKPEQSADYKKSEPFSKVHSERNTIAVSGIGGNYPVAVVAERENEICLIDEHNSVSGKLQKHNIKLVHIIEGKGSEMQSALYDIVANDTHPIILKNSYKADNLLDFQVGSAIDFGRMLIQGVGDAIWPLAPNLEPEIVNQTAYSILQATRARITRTEFISCPSCGRTLFDLENTLKEVKAATQHLKGLKIAVMGCIVNGPGEMADADYGYVGAGPGMVELFKGKIPIKSKIPADEAIPALIELIKQSGQWKEPDQV